MLQLSPLSRSARFSPGGSAKPKQVWLCSRSLRQFTSHFSPSTAALHYNSALSLWLSVDPLSDKYPNLSPYVYCANNPVRLVDPDGREWSFPDDPPSWGSKMKELWFCIKNVAIAGRIGTVKNGATNISTNSVRFATRGEVLHGSKRSDCDEGSENGAFRHALWQATITSEYGGDIAKEVGSAHEATPNTHLSIRTFSNLTEADQTVDLLNNIIGRKIGEQHKGDGMKSMAIAVLEEFYNNGFYTATANGKNWEVQKIRLSKDKHDQLFDIFQTLDDNGFTPSEIKSREFIQNMKRSYVGPRQ